MQIEFTCTYLNSIYINLMYTLPNISYEGTHTV